MNEIFRIRNKIIVFEVILLIIMLTISYEIKTLQQKMNNLSESRIDMLFAIHRLGHETKELSSLNRDYILTNDKSFKTQYLDVIENGYGLGKEIKHSELYKDIENLPFSKKENDLLKKAFNDFEKLSFIQNKAFNLFEKGEKNKAKQLILSRNYQNLEHNIVFKITKVITLLNKRMANLITIKRENVYIHFIVLASIGTLFVIINIYFFIYLSNLAVRELEEKENLLNEIDEFNNTLEKKVKQRTEEVEALMKVKSEFLANMSHEIRTPLNAMFGFVRILQEKDLDEESLKYLSIIEKSGKSLLTIINDILDFSKIEAGKLNIEKVEFNPKYEIDVIHNLFKGIASQKDIVLDINENLEYNIISDPVRLKQVIANLLSNAVKFSSEGSKIILNINYFDKSQNLCVEVIDEGIGIPENKLSHIFTAFSQADNSTTRKYGGTGLGLTISHKLIELLGGELKVESELGKGSKFYLLIPAPKTTKITTIKTEKKELISKEKFEGYILLVEDNKANQLFMKVVLEKMGIDFDIANDGFEAVEKFMEFKYDLILMDENMPNMNGIEATKRIREIEREKNLDHTPIIALTANAMEGDKERFIKAGMDYYLSKPLDIEKLQHIFKKI